MGVLEAVSADLSISLKDNINIPQGNKRHPFSKMGQPSLEGQGYDQHRGSHYFINQSNQALAKKEPDATSQAVGHFDSAKIRGDFPILAREINGHPLTWLDNEATSQKPNQVIDAVSQFYQQTNSNLHLGAHELAEEAIDMYEDTRVTNQKYINTARPEEIIFYRAQRRPLI